MTKLMTNNQSLLSLNIAPTKVVRGTDALLESGKAIALFGKQPLILGGNTSLNVIEPFLKPVLTANNQSYNTASYSPDCSESTLTYLRENVQQYQADFIIGIGGGKSLDAAKLLAHQCHLPVITIPTSAATCAAWSALSNIYTNEGAFLYDVTLDKCPDLLILDYSIIQTAPKRTLIAGIGDALAKWYESSVSSGNSDKTLIISAVQQARILRDILLQKSLDAINNPGSDIWREIVDATVLMAGIIGGLGGAQCRTVAAHAVHNGITHIQGSHHVLHGEKVAYGILVQLRLEEMIIGNQLAITSREQLLKFYAEIGLPKSLDELGLGNITLTELRQAADIALLPNSDIHRLPFDVECEQLMAAMVSTINSKKLMAIN